MIWSLTEAVGSRTCGGSTQAASGTDWYLFRIEGPHHFPTSFPAARGRPNVPACAAAGFGRLRRRILEEALGVPAEVYEKNPRSPRRASSSFSPTRNPRVRTPARHAGSSPLRVTPSGTDVSNLSWRARFDRRRRSSCRLDPSCRACASPSVRINSRQALARHAASVGRAT